MSPPPNTAGPDAYGARLVPPSLQMLHMMMGHWIGQTVATLAQF